MTRASDPPRPVVCGGAHEDVGCALVLTVDDLYRCADCHVPFCRSCLRAHFASSVTGVRPCSEVDELRQDIERLVRAIDRRLAR